MGFSESHMSVFLFIVDRYKLLVGLKDLIFRLLRT